MDWQGILILSMIGCGVFATGTWLALAWYWSPPVNPLFLILTKKGGVGGACLPLTRNVLDVLFFLVIY